MGLSIMWLLLIIAFVVIEALTAQMLCIWFAGGALVALVSSLFDMPLGFQITAFAVLSVALLVLTRPVVKKMSRGPRVRTNADRVIESIAVVTEEIDNLKSLGAVTVGGKVWSARAKGESPIPVGARVIVLAIEGVKVIVEKTEATLDK